MVLAYRSWRRYGSRAAFRVSALGPRMRRAAFLLAVRLWCATPDGFFLAVRLGSRSSRPPRSARRPLWCTEGLLLGGRTSDSCGNAVGHRGQGRADFLHYRTSTGLLSIIGRHYDCKKPAQPSSSKASFLNLSLSQRGNKTIERNQGLQYSQARHARFEFEFEKKVSLYFARHAARGKVNVTMTTRKLSNVDSLIDHVVASSIASIGRDSLLRLPWPCRLATTDYVQCTSDIHQEYMKLLHTRIVLFSSCCERRDSGV